MPLKLFLHRLERFYEDLFSKSISQLSIMRVFWNRIHFTNLYKEVLDKHFKIRIRRVHSDGIYELETYGKITIGHIYILDSVNGTICQITKPKPMPPW